MVENKKIQITKTCFDHIILQLVLRCFLISQREKSQTLKITFSLKLCRRLAAEAVAHTYAAASLMPLEALWDPRVHNFVTILFLKLLKVSLKLLRATASVASFRFKLQN